MCTATILVVEESSDVRELFADVLMDAGYQVYTLQPTDLSTAAIERARPDLLLLEITPATSTRTLLLLEELRRQPTTAPIPVLLSATSPQLLDRLDMLLRSLSCATLCKPFDLDWLLALIRQGLALQKPWRESPHRSRVG